jgi:hypothetical protein
VLSNGCLSNNWEPTSISSKGSMIAIPQPLLYWITEKANKTISLEHLFQTLYLHNQTLDKSPIFCLYFL